MLALGLAFPKTEAMKPLLAVVPEGEVVLRLSSAAGGAPRVVRRQFSLPSGDDPLGTCVIQP